VPLLSLARRMALGLPRMSLLYLDYFEGKTINLRSPYW